jgi:hypothetical protein
MSMPRVAVAKAITTSETLNPFFFKHMAIENAMLARAALSLGRKSADARVAHLLCELAMRLNGGVLDGPTLFELPLTQEQLGDVLGLTPVHVNRTFRQLRSSGAVERRGHVVEIPCIKRLSDIAQFDGSYLHLSANRNEGEQCAHFAASAHGCSTMRARAHCWRLQSYC